MVHVEIGNIIIQQVEAKYIVDFAGDSSRSFDDFKSALEAAWEYFNASGMEL